MNKMVKLFIFGIKVKVKVSDKDLNFDKYVKEVKQETAEKSLPYIKWKQNLLYF